MTTEQQSDWVEFFFDPICPWAYQASKWIREVAENVNLEVRWRFFSLFEINRESDAQPHSWEEDWVPGWSLMRVGAWLRRRDPRLLDRWYAETGRRFHEAGEPAYTQDRARAAAEALGLAEEFDTAIADPTTHDDVRRDHEYLVRTFSGFGVPTLVFSNGGCLFGPKVTPAPTGPEAMKLWHIMSSVSAMPDLYQIRKPMTSADLHHIDEIFSPYYRAREWETVQKSVRESSQAQ
jgi:DSBA-like thioredoxin domain